MTRMTVTFQTEDTVFQPVKLSACSETSTVNIIPRNPCEYQQRLSLRPCLLYTSEIFKNNNIQSVTVVRMEVPCCGGMEYAVKTAIEGSRKHIPCQVVTISTEGNIL